MALPGYSALLAAPFELVCSLVHEHLDLLSLHNASLVSHAWNKAFSPPLWDEPVKWIVDAQRPFTTFYKFMKIASRADETTRRQVKSIDLHVLCSTENMSRNIADYRRYETTITSDWIMRHHKLFPELRVVILDGLRQKEESGFHSEEEVFKSGGNGSRPYPTLMSFNRLQGSTVKYLQTVSIRALYYLDISRTVHDAQWNRDIQALQFLNLRCLSMDRMELLTTTFPVKLLQQGNFCLWSLSVRDNALDDNFIEKLLNDYGFIRRNNSLHPNPMYPLATDQELFDKPPFYTADHDDLTQPPYTALVPMRDDSLDGFLGYMQKATNNWTSLFDHEDIYLRRTGITHLYIAKNKVTSDAIHLLIHIANNRLQVLDIGSPLVKRKKVWHHIRMPDARLFYFKNCAAYGVVNYAKYFHHRNTRASRIQSLRIHHSFVTCVPTLVRSALKDGYLFNRMQEAETPLEGDLSKELEPGFEPQFNNGLRELTLTDIPTCSYGTILNSLVAFISMCQKQETLCTEAKNRPEMQGRRCPPLLSGLRVLTLEFLHPDPATTTEAMPSPSSRDQFLPASLGDFSFFLDPPAYRPIERDPKEKEKEKEVAAGGPKDVIAELRKVRANRFLPQWGGKLVVVRPKREYN